MSRSNADLLALKSELTNDPSHLGLTTNPVDDEANANKLNAVSATISIRKRSLATSTIFGVVDDLEHQALSDQQARWFGQMLELGQIDPFLDTETVAGLRNAFGLTTITRPAIEALLVQSGNRIDQLFQAGTLEEGGEVTPSDISEARAAT